MLQPVDAQREELRRTTYEARKRYRILFIGTFSNGPTDVVASLKRALENLGHWVFHVDTGRHRNMLDRSSGARAGYGPIFLGVAGLRSILDRFAPQVVITCAGGVVLDETAARELQGRGTVLIGMTLSDPDVQASVIDHVGMFDYHTTNALLAYEEYERMGLRNTLLLSFGIDRDYVLRSVLSDSSLTADVICIGHANGRADRHRVMSALAERFNVRVYGSGWPQQGAVAVKGDRLLQAAREGKFHVNFPATRAGFTNVKCGVFESVGAGGVLCTTEFDEMARLFEYGEEIVGYDDADDLGDKIEGLLADPEQFEQLRRSAFRRLVADHLYEHRWLTLFDEIEVDVRAETPRVGESRAAEIREVLEQDNPRARTVIVSGYFGARNLGDDMLLDAVTRGIEKDTPDAHVVVAASNPVVVEAKLGLPAFRRSDPFESDVWAARASAVVVGPGGLWHDYTIERAGGVAGLVTGATVSPAHLAQLPTMTVAHGGAFHVFGMGVGPLRDPAAQATVRLAGKLAKSVVVRDRASRQLLEDLIGWDIPVEQAPDIAYALELNRTPPLASRPPHVVVNMRPWEHCDVGVEQIREALTSVVRSRNIDVVGLSMQPADDAALRHLLDGVDIPRTLSIVPAYDSVDQFIEVLSGASAVVSMRLHTNLIAHRLGRPAVGLVYDPKVAAHFAEIGRSEFAIDLPVETASLVRILEAAIDETELDVNARATVTRLEEESVAAVAGLATRLGKTLVRAAAAGTIQRVSTPATAQQPARSRSATAASGWPSSQIVDLTAGRMTSENLDDPTRQVDHEHSVTRRRGVQFNLAASAPRRGDNASWQLTLPATRGLGTRFEIWLSSRYKEQRNRTGRIAYEVLVDDNLLFWQDVAAWKPRNTVWIARVPESDQVTVEVRVVALRDCEPWNWGPATAMRVEAMRQMAWEGRESLAWGASAPVFDHIDVSTGGEVPATAKLQSIKNVIRRRLASVSMVRT